MKNRKAFITLAAIVALMIGGYFFYLLHQVQTAFETQKEYVPTRIYSSATKIAPPQPKVYIEKKLRGLGYTPQQQGATLTFILHSPHYPAYLLPADHITPKLMDKQIKLTFEGTSDSAALESIHSELGAVNEFYLEPEFLATLNPAKDEASDKTEKIREVLKFEEFPKLIPDSVLAAEDLHFYEHFGIDPRGFARAIWNNLKSFSLSQGGSTITQQLVKNLMERRNRNIIMKINELFLAPVLELKYSKQQIFERYLNEVFLGQIGAFEVRGFAEGAKYFFGKSVHDLNSGEIALLVGLIKGPAFYSPYRHMDRAVARQHYVLERLLDTGKITREQFNQALKQPIRLAQAPSGGNRAPYFVDYIKAELFKTLSDRFEESEIPELGFQVYTTLDLEMNQIAQESLQKGLEQIEKSLGIEPILQGALAAMDQTTGEVRALIGGRNYAQSNFNRILNMKRQVGSTFKPIVYLAALRQMDDPRGNAYTPAYPLLDAPWAWEYDPKKPAWKPSNYDKDFKGWISLRTALARSVNTTAARIAQRVGLGEIVDTAKTLGIETKLLPVPSLSLGGVELSPVELLSAYSTIANHGASDTPLMIRAIINSDGSDYTRFEYEPKPKIDPGIADLMTDLLQTVFSDGTATVSRTWGYDRPSAGKTGTTNDYRDSWFVGYTPQLTALVWIGLDQGLIENAKKKIKLTGASAALPIWTQFMSQALKFEAPIPFAESEHLTEMRLDIKSGQKAESSCSESQVVSEKIINGREPKNSTCLSDYPKDI